MGIEIISQPISKNKAMKIGSSFYPDMVKGVVDIEKEIIALGGEYHIDANMILIANGSNQPDIWGFNIYPQSKGKDWIEYTSLINIRPSAKNKSMTVQSRKVRAKMKKIIENLIK